MDMVAKQLYRNTRISKFSYNKPIILDVLVKLLHHEKAITNTQIHIYKMPSITIFIFFFYFNFHSWESKN